MGIVNTILITIGRASEAVKLNRSLIYIVYRILFWVNWKCGINRIFLDKVNLLSKTPLTPDAYTSAGNNMSDGSVVVII